MKKPETDLHSKLFNAYGMSLAFHRKKIVQNKFSKKEKGDYFEEIYSHLTSEVEIEDMKKSEMIGKKIKKRYEHLKKFDKDFYHR